MLDLDRFQEIWITITRNKIRSVLTGFGVFWGIFMLVLMLGAGSGLEEGIMKSIDGFATNSCFFYTSQTGEPYKGFKKGRYWNMHNKDIDAIRQSVPEVEYISPILFGNNSSNNVARNERAGSFNVKGVYPVYTKLEQQRMKFGRFINEVDILQKRKVCVIGINVYKTLFKREENPLGCYIRINGIYFQLVGVSSGVSNLSVGGDAAENVYIPFTTMQQINNMGDIIHFLGVTIAEGYKSSVAEQKIKTVLRSQNDIAPTDTRAVGSFNIEEQFQIFSNLFLGIDIVIWFIGIGTLLSGIIGVSNIMMITVRERTREIGIRRALGAKPAVIMNQVLSESIILTLLAGILGLCLGVGILGAMNMLLETSAANGSDSFYGSPIIPFDTAIVSLVILLISGMIAGIIPTIRALKIKAIDAIREE